ncbi:MAG TPA: hypothetical protein VJA21_10720 [Verrucomicrobiae bacterium]
MFPEQEANSGSDRREEQPVPESRRPSHRSGRGRRGRGRGRGRGGSQPATSLLEPAPAADTAVPPENRSPAEAEPEPVRFEDLPPVPEAPLPEPDIPFPEVAAALESPDADLTDAPEGGPPATVQEAIDRVSNVIETLRHSLDDMEEVLELLESLERQTVASEHELETLRRTLRQFHRPLDRPPHQRGRH